MFSCADACISPLNLLMWQSNVYILGSGLYGGYENSRSIIVIGVYGGRRTCMKDGICRTYRGKLAKPTFPSLFLRCKIGFSLSMPELKRILKLFLEPIRIICKLIFSNQRVILLELVSVTETHT